MSPPGDGLVFKIGRSLDRGNSAPALVDAAQKLYEENPHSFRAIPSDLKLGELEFEDRKYELLIFRHGLSDVYILAIALIVNGVGVSDKDKKYFIDLYRR